MSHPFLSLPPRLLPRLFWPLLAFTLVLMAVMTSIGVPLSTPDVPKGIISFEFAGTVTRAGEILDSWGHPGQLRAAFIQGLDTLFLLVYSTTLGLGCIWAAGVLRDRRRPLASWGPLLAWGMWLAAGFDALENVALVILLFGGLGSPWPQIAWVCAAVKFALIFLGLVYTFFAAALRLVTR